jgi:putative ABC transport system permease protein
MLRILFRNSLRSLLNQKPYSFINIAGLTIGLTAVLLLLSWIAVETTYDRFHADADRIYRVALNVRTPNKLMKDGAINAPAGPEYRNLFPTIEEMVRLNPYEQSVTCNDRSYTLHVLYTDSTFFRVFSFDLLTGDKESCLTSPQSIVLTERTVRKLFGKEDPLGKKLFISGKNYSVTGIAKDPPVNTMLQFDCLSSLKVIEKEALYIGWDGGLTCYTYLKLVKGADPSVLEKQIHEYMEDVINKRVREYGFEWMPYLQKIDRIHLDSDTEFDMGEKGSRTRIYLFSGIGLLVLLIACFNFVNISTALSFKRAREVSIKKIFGSGRKQIILFFIIESAIAIIISLTLAFLLSRILQPATSGLLGKELSMSPIKPLSWLLIFLAIFLFCTVFASFYSAFYLSASSPLALLSDINRGKKRQTSRNFLVIFQYMISAALILCSLIVYEQMQYVKNADKGFDERNLLVLSLNKKAAESYELIRSSISVIPGVLSATAVAGGSPGLGFTSNGYLPEGAQQPVMSNAVYVDENYLKTMGIPLSEGRDFRSSRADRTKVIINQTFEKMMGWENSLGKTVERNDIKYEIIGVVKDFHTSSFHKKTEPLFISLINEHGSYEDIVIRYQPSALTEILGKSRAMMKEISPQYPFEYSMLEDSLWNSYAREQKMNILFLILSVISIFISSLGLFGLTTFTTQSRSKEICIRKTSGAQITDIIKEFNFGLLKLILVSFIIAFPAGLYAMQKWLDGFAYRTTINISVFAVAGLFILAIGILTVSWAAYNPAKSNPAEILRKE